MDNQYDQSKVAYESAPKEVNKSRRVANSNEQFGKANRMEQDNKGYKQRDYPANPTLSRFGESR